MTRREQRYLERVLILRTIINNGAPMYASDIADRASTECDHDALEQLPTFERRGMAAKLSAMWDLGMVEGEWSGDRLPLTWKVTDHGRKVAASLDERAPALQGTDLTGGAR